MNKEQYDHGMAVRRAVMGDDYVDAALRHAGEQFAPLQDLVTEYGWGAVWTRPGLDRRTRSLLNLAMITALNRPHELKGHIRGALTNGVTRAEIVEVFLQAGVYCGLPAALDSARVAQETFAEVDRG